MKVTRRQFLILAATGTLILVIWTAWFDTESGEAVVEMSSNKKHAETVGDNGQLKSQLADNALQARNADANKFSRDLLNDALSDPFKILSYLPPAPKEPEPLIIQPPPRPVAPPLPYHYFGHMVDVDGAERTYLIRDTNVIPVESKTILDNDYRIDSIDENKIEITYLPLDEKKIIPVFSSEQVRATQ